jgi:hypothetical protein
MSLTKQINNIIFRSDNTHLQSMSFGTFRMINPSTILIRTWHNNPKTNPT